MEMEYYSLATHRLKKVYATTIKPTNRFFWKLGQMSK